MFKQIVLATTFLLFLLVSIVFGDLKDTNSGSLTIYDRNQKVLFHESEGNNQFGSDSADHIPYRLLSSSLVTEDQRFWTHMGIDPIGLARAVWEIATFRFPGSGGSTISQQVSRNLLGINRSRNILNKAEDVFLAIYLEKNYNKDAISKYYFNHINYGGNVLGITSASEQFFNTSIDNLDWSQATSLASLIKNANQINNLPHLESRQNYIGKLLLTHHLLSADEAANIKLPTIHTAKIAISAPHFVYFVLHTLEEQYGRDFWHGHIVKITTTLDLDLYKKTLDITKEELGALSEKNVHNSSTIVLDNTTGEILSYVGNSDFFDDKHAGAVDMVQALRQPGSALKPFVYLATILEGWGSGTVLYDIPSRFLTSNETPYTPLNYDLDFHGPVTMRQALANSYNIPAVKALAFVGIPKVKKLLEDFGIDTLSQADDYYGLSLALGSGEVRLYQLANAYRTLANKGAYTEPQFLQKILIDNTNMPLREKQVMTTDNSSMGQSTDIITNILSDTKARAPEFEEYNALTFSYPVAAKTGTSRNFHDNWTVGYSQDYTIGVWTGNSDGSAMEQVSGISGAGPIFQRVMRSLPTPKSQDRFRMASDIAHTTICLPSGLLPSAYCQHTIEELFLPGKQPKEQDTWYQKDGLHLPTELSTWQQKFSNTLLSQSGINIIKPQEKDVFQFDAEIPDEQEKIPCQILAPKLTAIKILLNQKLISQNPNVCILPKTPGNYTLTVEGINNMHQLQQKNVHYSVTPAH